MPATGLPRSEVAGASRYYNDQPVDYLFYQGMALARLGRVAEAQRLFEGWWPGPSKQWASRSRRTSSPSRCRISSCWMTIRSTNTVSTACWSGLSASWGWISVQRVPRPCASCSPSTRLTTRGLLFALICRELSLNPSQP
ncbi:hypothetical protein H2136_05810 [Aeromonas hydrophila]|uniref:Uncharacterized protein n=1 Tax=Aeromonas hydrophila TaxID=644 RepID=A0A926FNF8_AERHY|nr:hypothetical protein [Aeromonas hydrophila]